MRYGGDFSGTFGDDAVANFANDGIGGREIVCLCSKLKDCARGGYMLAKTCMSCFSAACCELPTMLSGVG